MPPPTASDPHIHHFVRWGGLGLTAVAVAYFCVHAARNWSELTALQWNGSGLAALFAGLGLYVVLLGTAPLAWFALLRGVGETPRYIQVLTISLLSQFAKYIPGNVAHHIGRVALARGFGLSTGKVIVTMTIETGWVVFTGATVGLFAVLLRAPVLLDGGGMVPGIWQIAIAGMVGALVPVAAAWLLDRWQPGPLRRMLGAAAIRPPVPHALLACFGAQCALFLLMGAMLHLLASWLLGLAGADYWLATGVFAVAWVAGFIVPGAPGGLGVREAILIAGLGPVYGEPGAVAVALLLRALSTIGDGIGFLGGLVARRAARL